MNALRILLSAALLSAASAAQPAVFTFVGTLGPEAVGATGSGSVQVDYDDVARTLAIDASFSGLSGTTTVAHIHCCTATPGTGTAGVAVTPTTLPDFPVGVTSGSYPRTIDLASDASYTAAFRNGNGGTSLSAELALFAGMNSGRAYFNIHSSAFPGGEIRAFLAPVPEPGTVALMLAGLGAVGFAVRRRRR
jgi:hypothetical protein